MITKTVVTRQVEVLIDNIIWQEELNQRAPSDNVDIMLVHIICRTLFWNIELFHQHTGAVVPTVAISTVRLVKHLGFAAVITIVKPSLHSDRIQTKAERHFFHFLRTGLWILIKKTNQNLQFMIRKSFRSTFSNCHIIA